MNKTDVENYEFISFTEGSEKTSKVVDYKIKDLNENVVGKRENLQKIIKLERSLASQNDFKFSEIVEKHRGLKKQKEEEEQASFNRHVNTRVHELKEKAFGQGLEQGQKQGEDKAYGEFKTKTDEFSHTLEEIILKVRNTEGKILSDQKKNVYELIRGMAKWVILRELKDDGKYLDRLLEKLIYELNTRSNIIVQVNEKTFESMDSVIESVQKKIGKLDNVRVEIIPELEDDAIVLETENGILDASMTEQFSSLDEIFNSLDILNEQ